jgi:hypothetical protein
MNRTEYLLDQAERAERLASSALDPLTMDRLKDFATECRKTLEGLALESIHAPLSAPYRRITEPPQPSWSLAQTTLN